MFLSLYLTSFLFAFSLEMEIERPYYHIDKAREYFRDFTRTYRKFYRNDEERQVRFEIFKENLIHLNHLNTFSESIHGVTEFSDMLEEEFSHKYGSCLLPAEQQQYSSCKVITDADLSTKQAPPTLDYRQQNAVTPVKDQFHCNCCWAFATVGTLEAQYAMRYRELVSLSAQQLMDCLRTSGHCAAGNSMTAALSEMIQTPGVETESDYPYYSRDLQCQLVAAKARVRVTGCLNFQLTNEDSLKEALFKYGPIAIAINAVPLRTHWTGIIDATTCPTEKLGHGVLLVGYGTEYGRDYWIIKNSWGAGWGPEQGYVRFARGQNTCGMLNPYAASGVIA